ncbi:MAG TPA: hypothetical protein VGR47_08940 [Terracidiphilus sp.]|nr:hypothetical protein [Terracidiphilus sp.]
MTTRLLFLAAVIVFAALPAALAQDAGLTLPKTVQAGQSFAVSSSGNGTLYIIGPGQVLKKSVRLREPLQLPAGSLVNAGHYLAILASDSGSQSATFDVLPSQNPARISFLAEPSRLPVDLSDGVAGAVYVFDRFGNLIVNPTPVSFELSVPSGTPQQHSVVTKYGAAWTKMSTTAHEGIGSFVARAGDVSVSRSVYQVAGDPCRLTMTVQPSRQGLQLQTDPVRDCSGNPVPDGTIVSFSESYDGGISTADVPLKHGIAKVDLPAHRGGLLSVASGVVLGNQIRWEK